MLTDSKVLSIFVGEGKCQEVFVAGNVESFSSMEACCRTSFSHHSDPIARKGMTSVSRLALWAVVNVQHAGFHTTIYDNKEAWNLVLVAIEANQLQELERMGIVCDLLLQRQTLLSKEKGSIEQGEVKMLLTRLTDVVQRFEIWKGESPAYWNGRLFLLEMEFSTILDEAGGLCEMRDV